jgi:hypothetical protein
MQVRFERLGLAAVVVAACGAAAAPAAAMTLPAGWEIAERPGTRVVAVPAGATAVEVVAIGGRGGGATGGAGAAVSATIPVRAGQVLTFRVGSDGGTIGSAPPAGTTLPGDGGGATAVSLCDPSPATCNAILRRVLVAAGGGGSGGGTATLPGGAGGDAGAPGAAGLNGPLGVGAGLGGGAGTAADGGAGGAAVPIPVACTTGISGPGGGAGFSSLGSGGTGGKSTVEPLPSRHGGNGGDGHRGGGGGSAAALCDGEQAGGGGGGGGGANLVPAGGTASLVPATTASAPSVRWLFQREQTAPTVTIGAPVDGGVYAQGAIVRAAYSCADEPGGSGVATCTGTVAADAAIDTATPGRKEFRVSAIDAAGNATLKTVSYTVHAVVTGAVRANARAIRFRASGPLRATVRIERRAPGRKVRWKLVASRTVSARAGANTVATSRRALAPGRYRAVVTVQGARGLPQPKPAAFVARAKKKQQRRGR